MGHARTGRARGERGWGESGDCCRTAGDGAGGAERDACARGGELGDGCCWDPGFCFGCFVFFRVVEFVVVLIVRVMLAIVSSALDGNVNSFIFERNEARGEVYLRAHSRM